MNRESRGKEEERRGEERRGEGESNGDWELELLLNTKKFHIGSCTAVACRQRKKLQPPWSWNIGSENCFKTYVNGKQERLV